MRGKLRFTVYMAVAYCLASLLTFGPPAFASAPPISQNFTGYAVIDGPVYLQISISPPVTSPGQSIAVDVTLTLGGAAGTLRGAGCTGGAKRGSGRALGVAAPVA